MNIILFGPPGVGKSTLIGFLKTKGFGAIDLEDLWPNASRFQVLNWVDGKFIGAADLSPKRHYNNALKVLLTLSEDEYAKRRASRDAAMPQKAAQRKHTMSEWTKDVTYDAVVDVTNLQAALDTLGQLMKSPKVHMRRKEQR